MRNEQKWLAFVAALCVSPPALRADLPAYRLVQLKGPSESSPCVARDVNNQSQAVGECGPAPTAIIWTDGQPLELGIGLGQAINETGTVLVGGDGYEAFIWDAESGSRTFPLPDGFGWLDFGGISDAGQIAGTAIARLTSAREAFLFDGQSFTFFRPFGAQESSGLAINALGHVAGQWSAADREGAFLYRDGETIELSPPVGWREMWPYDINDHDVIVGLVSSEENMTRAFRYDVPNDQWLELPTTSDGSPAIAYGVNNHGQAVGWIQTAGAALWDSDGTLYLLNELMPPELGWDLLYALAINDSGVICGGEDPYAGLSRAFLLVPGRCAGDILPDSTIDLADLAAFLSAFGSCTGDATFEPAADLNENGCIELDDLGELVARFGMSCW